MTEPAADAAADLLVEAGLHGHACAIDATVAETALHQPGPVALLTSDVDDTAKLCGSRIRLIAIWRRTDPRASKTRLVIDLVAGRGEWTDAAWERMEPLVAARPRCRRAVGGLSAGCRRAVSGMTAACRRAPARSEETGGSATAAVRTASMHRDAHRDAHPDTRPDTRPERRPP